MPAVLNAANETSVQAFLDGRIKLSDIARINEAVMQAHEPTRRRSSTTILDADRWARRRRAILCRSSLCGI